MLILEDFHSYGRSGQLHRSARQSVTSCIQATFVMLGRKADAHAIAKDGVCIRQSMFTCAKRILDPQTYLDIFRMIIQICPLLHAKSNCRNAELRPEGHIRSPGKRQRGGHPCSKLRGGTSEESSAAASSQLPLQPTVQPWALGICGPVLSSPPPGGTQVRSLRGL